MRDPDFVTKVVARQIVKRIKLRPGVEESRERDKFLSKHGDELKQDLDKLISKWAEVYPTPWEILFQAAQDYQQGQISEEGFCVHLRAYAESEPCVDDINALVACILKD